MKGGKLLAIPNQPDVYEGPTYPAHIQHMEMKPAYIDMVAIVVGSSIRISILNRHPSADWEANHVFDGFGQYKPVLQVWRMALMIRCTASRDPRDVFG
jgi:alpha-N-arabinofuranosidase